MTTEVRPPPASVTVLTATATGTVRQMIAGPVGPARLVGTFPRAAYVRLADGRVIGILTRDAVRLPCGLVIAARSDERRLDDLQDPVLVGRSQVSIGAVTVRIGRVRSASAPTGLAPVPGAVAHVAAELTALRFDEHDPAVTAMLMCYEDLAPRAELVADALLGAGPGLTPAGDDVLCGFLVAAQSVGVPCAALAAQVRARAMARTVPLSATLLCHACQGETIPHMARLLNALCDPAVSLSDLHHALGELLSVGHTSGSALAVGVLAACKARLHRR